MYWYGYEPMWPGCFWLCFLISVSSLLAFAGITEYQSVTVTAVTVELRLSVCVSGEADTLQLSSSLINDSGQVADVAIHTN